MIGFIDSLYPQAIEALSLSTLFTVHRNTHASVLSPLDSPLAVSW
jgi:hypothetical protein